MNIIFSYAIYTYVYHGVYYYVSDTFILYFISDKFYMCSAACEHVYLFVLGARGRGYGGGFMSL